MIGWSRRTAIFIEQNIDALKYFFCATFPGRGAYRLVAEKKRLSKQFSGNKNNSPIFGYRAVRAVYNSIYKGMVIAFVAKKEALR